MANLDTYPYGNESAVTALRKIHALLYQGGGGVAPPETDPLSVHRAGGVPNGVMTGLLTLSGPPTDALHAATKAYVDAPADGKTYGRQGAVWVPTAAHESFGGAVLATIIGAEAQGDVIATLTILPADLPDQPFYWVCEGSGVGHMYMNTLGATGSVISMPLLGQVLDGGAWLNTASISTSGVVIGGPLQLIRGSPSAPGGSRLFHYDPAVDVGGIQCRLTVSTVSPTGPATFNFGLEGQIIAYA